MKSERHEIFISLFIFVHLTPLNLLQIITTQLANKDVTFRALECGICVR